MDAVEDRVFGDTCATGAFVRGICLEKEEDDVEEEFPSSSSLLSLSKALKRAIFEDFRLHEVQRVANFGFAAFECDGAGAESETQ